MEKRWSNFHGLIKQSKIMLKKNQTENEIYLIKKKLKKNIQ